MNYLHNTSNTYTSLGTHVGTTKRKEERHGKRQSIDTSGSSEDISKRTVVTQ